jgi:hypothetical protein
MRSIFGCVPVYAKDMEKKTSTGASASVKVATAVTKTLIPEKKKVAAGGGQLKLDYMFDKMLLSKKLTGSKH